MTEYAEGGRQVEEVMPYRTRQSSDDLLEALRGQLREEEGRVMDLLIYGSDSNVGRRLLREDDPRTSGLLRHYLRGIQFALEKAS